MTTYQRQGECNQCGDCCENGPWWRNWPSAVRNWDARDVGKMFPHSRILPLPTHGGPVKGMAQVEGEEYPYEWVEGYAVVKSTDCHDCPFLRGVKGDEQRPCALYDTKYHYMWDELCRKSPPGTRSNQTQVDNWFANNPNCSYTFVEVPE